MLCIFEISFNFFHKEIFFTFFLEEVFFCKKHFFCKKPGKMCFFLLRKQNDEHDDLHSRDVKENDAKRTNTVQVRATISELSSCVQTDFEP